MFNQAIVIGFVGGDSETRYFPDGSAVANFTVATTDKWKDKASGEMKEATEWHRIEVFGRQAEFASQHVKKGCLVMVQGQTKTRKWTDKQGIERYTTTLKAQELKMLKWAQEEGAPKGQFQGKPQDTQPPPPQPMSQPKQDVQTGFRDFEDDIPF